MTISHFLYPLGLLFSHGKIHIPSDFKISHRKLLYSHGISHFSHGKLIVPWELKISHGISNYPMGKTNNPMGKFKIPLEFTPLVLIISPARCEQVKRKVVFDYAEHDLQHGGNGLSLCLTYGGCILAKIVLAELNWTVLKMIHVIVAMDAQVAC